MRLIRISLFFLCSMFFMSIGMDKAPKEVSDVAIHNVTSMAKGSLLATDRKSMGFNDTDKVSDISVGEPFRIYYIGPDDLREIDTNKTKTVIDLNKNNPNYPWHVIVYVNGEAKFISEIVNYGDFWGVGHFGYDPN